MSTRYGLARTIATRPSGNAAQASVAANGLARIRTSVAPALPLTVPVIPVGTLPMISLRLAGRVIADDVGRVGDATTALEVRHRLEVEAAPGIAPTGHRHSDHLAWVITRREDRTADLAIRPDEVKLAQARVAENRLVAGAPEERQRLPPLTRAAATATDRGDLAIGEVDHQQAAFLHVEHDCLVAGHLDQPADGCEWLIEGGEWATGQGDGSVWAAMGSDTANRPDRSMMDRSTEGLRWN